MHLYQAPASGVSVTAKGHAPNARERGIGMTAPVAGWPNDSSMLAPPRNGGWRAELANHRCGARQAGFDPAVATPGTHSLGRRPTTIQRELDICPMPGGDRLKRIRLGGAIRGAALRALAVAALALAGLLVFGLLPGGRDTPTVIPSQYPLPPVPTMHDLHPHGPNRLVTAC
jgi:hypothetical protein